MTQVAEKLSSELRRDLADLERLRGEVELQLHLMTMDMKSKWHALEKRWEGARNDAKLTAGTAARQLTTELRADYQKLKDELRAAV
jgi:Skp family chaperone for outer membrane proteins